MRISQMKETARTIEVVVVVLLVVLLGTAGTFWFLHALLSSFVACFSVSLR